MDFTIGLITNVGWKAEALGDAAAWITVGEATENTQVLTVRRNDGDERSGQVRFYALGTGLEDFQATVNIKQFDQARQMMKQMMGGGKKRMRLPFGKFRG